MKRTALLLTFLITSQFAFSQESQQTEALTHRDVSRNELSLNVFNILIFGAIDGSYERILNDHSSLGVEVFSKAFNKNKGEDIDLAEAYTKDFSVTTKFKYFFRENKSAHGFYAEAFGMYSDGWTEKEVEISTNGSTYLQDVDVEYSDFALGFGVGGKFVSKNGFLIDLSFGIGRNLFNRDSPDLVVLPNINVGYRF